MDWGSVIAALIAGGLVAIINLVDSRLKRKDKVTDDKSETAQQVENFKGETAKQIENFKEETTEQLTMFGKCIKEVQQTQQVFREAVEGLSKDTKLVIQSQKAQAYDRIRHLGMQYIKKNKVMESEYKNLLDMYSAYTDLLGKKDEFLQRVMDEVAKVRIIPDGGDYHEVS